MILIADSGATKTDWCFGTTLSDRQTIQTEGINPFHMDKAYIDGIILQQLIPQLPASALSDCTAIHFYGAGCLPERTEGITRTLRNLFPQATVQVNTDLLGAARALCQREPGIACILGTGSNSCLYDGTRIVGNISPLGYILGDEGSGAYLGKRFLGDCLKRQLPGFLAEGLMERYGLTLPDLLEKVYRQPQANRLQGVLQAERPALQTDMACLFCRLHRVVLPARDSGKRQGASAPHRPVRQESDRRAVCLPFSPLTPKRHEIPTSHRRKFPV